MLGIRETKNSRLGETMGEKTPIETWEGCGVMTWEYKINGEIFVIQKTGDGYFIIGMKDTSETDGGFFRLNQHASANLAQAQSVLLDQIEEYSYANWS